ncbi:MFS general substrate transporter [Atractiella rhizophila]|nr:MFS general substrate transporter [Atractiella rhizophila]
MILINTFETGWVVVFCSALANAVTWGINAVFGVYLSFYKNNNFFPGATSIDYAYVGGLSISIAMLVAPLANFLISKWNFRVPLILGTTFVFCAQLGAAYSTKIAHLFVTQGVMFGIGLGFTFVPVSPLATHWFHKKRGIAMGLVAGGSGLGGLVLALSTRASIENISLKVAFIINACVSLGGLLPGVFLLKGRKAVNAKFETFRPKWFIHPGFSFVLIWAWFTSLAYVLCLYSVASFATRALGLSESTASAIQSSLSAGALVGRPLCGFILDIGGRINMTAVITFTSGLTVLLIWIFSDSSAALFVFAVLQGATGGVLWGAAGPVGAEVVGVSDLGSALAVFWITIVIPCTFAQAIAEYINDYSATVLHRTGRDVYTYTQIFSGLCYVTGALALLGAKRYVQGNWKIFVKT